MFCPAGWFHRWVFDEYVTDVVLEPIPNTDRSVETSRKYFHYICTKCGQTKDTPDYYSGKRTRVRQRS